MSDQTELRLIEERYARRSGCNRYSPLRPEVYLQDHERIARTADYLRQGFDRPMAELSLVDVGCGTGGILMDFIRMGFNPAKLCGLELLDNRLVEACARLPSSVRLLSGDACVADIAPGSQDVVFQSVVFSSILDDGVQAQLAQAMWNWLKPGGAVIWYDFMYNNPSNKDVRGVPKTRIRALFPQGDASFRRVTLAPPLSRRAVKVGNWAHNALHALPLLRSHWLGFIRKGTGG